MLQQPPPGVAEPGRVREGPVRPRLTGVEDGVLNRSSKRESSGSAP